MKQISIVAVLIGAITDILGTNLFNSPIAIYVMLANGLLNASKVQQPGAMVAALHGNVWLYGTTIIIGGACSILGGYVAAWIAKRSEVLNGALSSFLCVGFAIYAMAKGLGDWPVWLTIAILPVSPALGAFGGHLRRLGRKRAANAA